MFGGIIGQRFGLAETDGLKAAGRNTRLGKGGHYGTGAVIGKLLITARSPHVIGVALHGQAQLWVLPEQRQYLCHRGRRLGPEGGFIRVEVEVEGYVAFRV